MTPITLHSAVKDGAMLDTDFFAYSWSSQGPVPLDTKLEAVNDRSCCKYGCLINTWDYGYIRAAVLFSSVSHPLFLLHTSTIKHPARSPLFEASNNSIGSHCSRWPTRTMYISADTSTSTSLRMVAVTKWSSYMALPVLNALSVRPTSCCAI